LNAWLAEKEADPTSDALEVARQYMLKELDVYRWVGWAVQGGDVQGG